MICLHTLSCLQHIRVWTGESVWLVQTQLFYCNVQTSHSKVLLVYIVSCGIMQTKFKIYKSIPLWRASFTCCGWDCWTAVTTNTHSDHVLLHEQQARVTVSCITDWCQTTMGVLQRDGWTLAVCLAVVEIEGILGTITERQKKSERVGEGEDYW